VFFGEGLPEVYHKSINDDKNKCDLLIVIGSSLKVKPVANIPLLLPKSVPQVLINRESLRHMNFDVELLGDCDGIVNEILNRLEQRRLARLNKDASSVASADSAAVDQVDEVGWADICRDKTLLQRFEGKEAEDLVFAGENRFEEKNPIIHYNIH
jgi:thiamine pyrophosphate-dependent acetolactate synthase large subunit-like protein